MGDTGYYKLSDYLKNRYGAKVWKIPVDAGFSCPNRDGTIASGGCSYCNVTSFDGAEQGDIAEQVQTRIQKLKKRGIHNYIIYFQSYSNTYADVDTIADRIEKTLTDEGIKAVYIGTRPDTIDRQKLEYLKKINEKYDVVVEYGLQSANDATLKRINRGHSVQDFADAVRLTHEYGISVCAHLIFGLPGDSFEDMMASVALINELGVSMVKFHHLHIVRGTLMQKQYEAGEIKVLSEEEYIEILAEAVGRLKKDTVVARTVGDAGDDSLIAPRWETDKNQFEKRLADYMQARGISQGSLLDL